MGNAIFPTLPGLSIDVTRTPMWATTRKTSISQREFRCANMSFPRYKVKLSFEVLRQTSGYTEFSQLVGFFNARQGGFDSFLWTDPEDNAVTAQIIGIGTGSTTAFQLKRNFGGFAEPVYDVNSAPLIYVNGVLQTLTTHYTISASALVTFVSAPGAALPVTWTGSYYRRMCFLQDKADFSQIVKNLWALKSLELVSVKP